MDRKHGDTAPGELGGARPPIRILPRRSVAFGGFAIVIGTAAVTAWLWMEAGSNPQTRIEAIKTGFAVGFGLGGFLALALAARRQWLQERTQIHQEDVAAINQAHQDRVAAASEHDASERRITELYIKSIEQLGSTKAPVRLGGLHALERLAQANAGQRQTISDVICAYLRMPFTPPDDTAGLAEVSPPGEESIPAESIPAESTAPDEETQTGRREELQVRLTAQRVLASHLRAGRYADRAASGPPPATFWADIDLDLTGAHLVDFDLHHCRIRTIQLNNATLAGESLFRGMTCSLALAQAVKFNGHTDFRGAVFTNDAWFADSVFSAQVWFHADDFYPGACFNRHASFNGVTFAGLARFSGVTFGDTFDFGAVKEGPNGINVEDARVENPSAVHIMPPGCGLASKIDGRSSVLTRDHSRAPRPALDEVPRGPSASEVRRFPWRQSH